MRDNADIFLRLVWFRLTGHYEGRHDANSQRGSFVDEGFRQKMSQCQHKGPKSDVVEPAGASEMSEPVKTGQWRRDRELPYVLFWISMAQAQRMMEDSNVQMPKVRAWSPFTEEIKEEFE